MTYNGSSLSEWLAEYRSRRPATEVVMYRVTLPALLADHPDRNPVASLCISRYEDPDNPRPDPGIYLFSLDQDAEWVNDSWHEALDDAFDQAETYFGIKRDDWVAVKER